MRTTGLGLSALMIAAGAVLAWAVTYEASGIDLQQVGVIVFIVGLALAAITIIAGAIGRTTTVDSTREGVIDGRPVVEHQRDIVTENVPV